MKVSYNWLKEYLPVDMPVADLANILTSLGLEVSAVEHFESVKGGFNGVIAGKVIECQKHPNADRLTLTKVDIGTGNLLQIVCGAPNVAEGQTVWVATVGSTLYPTDAEKPLVIAKAKVRGEFSEGMICAEDELGLGKDHSGILILPDTIAKGTHASEYYQVKTDDVIDIELTPNRSDAICHLGVARDLAAWYSVNKGPIALRLPVIPDNLPKKADYHIDVTVKNNEACPRYCGVTLTGITIQESPAWLQNRLRAIDVRPINNVVDITNFVLHEMGQPLHAFDADKIKGKNIIVQTLPRDTTFVTLDNVERKLSEEDLMICDGASDGMCIAGVYGGVGSGISEKTTSIFLESAHFHPRWIRRTSVRHDLRTEAARTFEKSTDPNVCADALKRAVELIVELTGGQVASEVIDIYPSPVAFAHVTVRKAMINKLTGVNIPTEKVREILNALNMQIAEEDDTLVTVAVPTNKADVIREADVIEEILRIYGFDQVGMKPKMEIALVSWPPKSMSILRDDLGNFLASHGFLEMMSMSLIESRLYQEGPLKVEPGQAILINNTSNVHLDMMRHNMLASVIEAVRFNQNRMQSNLMLCEFGRTYARMAGDTVESEKLALALSGSPIAHGWRQKTAIADFFMLKKCVYLILEHLGIRPPESRVLMAGQWEYALALGNPSAPLVSFGKISRAVIQQYDLKNQLFYADFDMSALLKDSKAGTLVVSEIPKFPAVHRDIAIVLPKQTAFGDVEKSILQAGGQLLTDYGLFDVYENAEALGKEQKSLAISMVFQDMTRTLTETDINKAVSTIVSALAKETGAVLR